jgi:hypothetical protein
MRDAGGSPPARTSLSIMGGTLPTANLPEGPAAVTEIALPPTRRRAWRPRASTVAGGLVVLVLAAGLGWRMRAPAGPGLEPPGEGGQELLAPLPLPFADADGGLPAAAAAEEPEPLPPPMGALDAGEPDAGHPRAAPAPGTRALLDRMVRLERRAKRAPSFDPSALPLLQRLRLKLKADESGTNRRKVAAELDQWERAYFR